MAQKPTNPKSGANLTREQRRDAARAQAAQMRAAQEARERRTRNILIGVLGFIIVLAVALGIVIWQIGAHNAKKTVLDDFEGAVPANVNNHGGVVVGQSGVAGEATPGAPDLDVYIDFMCPICGEFERINADDLETLRTQGDLNVTYNIISILDRYSTGDSQFSTRSANAAATVANGAPAQFVDFVEAMFEHQPEEQTAGLTDAEMTQIAIDAGVPEDVANTFADGTYIEWVTEATEQATKDGVTGTPTVFFDGKKLTDVSYFTPGALGTWLADQGVGK